MLLPLGFFASQSPSPVWTKTFSVNSCCALDIIRILLLSFDSLWNCPIHPDLRGQLTPLYSAALPLCIS